MQKVCVSFHARCYRNLNKDEINDRKAERYKKEKEVQESMLSKKRRSSAKKDKGAKRQREDDG